MAVVVASVIPTLEEVSHDVMQFLARLPMGHDIRMVHLVKATRALIVIRIPRVALGSQQHHNRVLCSGDHWGLERERLA